MKEGWKTFGYIASTTLFIVGSGIFVETVKDLGLLLMIGSIYVSTHYE